MRTQYAIALAVIAGFGLGAASIHTLHAQAKPPVFVVAEINVSNPEAYAKEYVPKAQALIKKHGGKFLAASNNVVAFEGAPAKRIATVKWEHGVASTAMDALRRRAFERHDVVACGEKLAAVLLDQRLRLRHVLLGVRLRIADVDLGDDEHGRLGLRVKRVDAGGAEPERQ